MDFIPQPQDSQKNNTGVFADCDATRLWYRTVDLGTSRL